jgi:hypothetical protein
MVRVGLPLVGFGVCLLWILFAWATVGLLAEGEAFVVGWPWAVVGVLGVVFLAMQIVGQLLCLTVPREWHIRRSEGLALALNLLHLGLFLGVFLYRWSASAGTGLWALRLLVPALHLVFLTNFTPRIGQEPLGKRAETLILILLALLLFPVLFLVGMLFLGMVLGPYALIALPILVGLALVLDLAALIGFMNLHLSVYHAIPRYLETFAEKQKLKEAGWVDQPPW